MANAAASTVYLVENRAANRLDEATIEGAAELNIDPAATAWLLASTALVLLMTPGLAIFYGGMVRTTGVLNMIMMSFISIPLVTVAWLLVGYSLAFSDGVGPYSPAA